MNNEPLKIYFLNILTIAITFTNLENILKIVLLCVSIVYTAIKIIDWVSTKIKNKNEDNDKKII